MPLASAQWLFIISNDKLKYRQLIFLEEYNANRIWNGVGSHKLSSQDNNVIIDVDIPTTMPDMAG